MLGVVRRQVPVVELDEIVQRHILLPGTEIYNIRQGQKRERVQLVTLTIVDHVPHESHLVAHLPVVLEVVETLTGFAHTQVLETPLALGPLEGQVVLLVLGLDPVLAAEENSADHLVVVTPTQIEVPLVIRSFLYRVELEVL